MPTEKDNNILRELEELEKKESTPSPLLEFYKKLLRIQSKAEQRIEVPELGLTDKAISGRVEKGLPLIAFSKLKLDWALLRDVFTKVITLFSEYPELLGEVPESLRESGADRFLTREAVKAWFEGAKLPAKIAADNINERLLEDIIQATLGPFLMSYAKASRSYVDQERWRRRYCPVCGGQPDFAFLDKESGARWLLCSRCNTEWLFQRLECPYCGSTDQNDLAYFTNDEGLYRLYVCERCKRYLKTINLRQAKSEVPLSLERLLTLHMDAQAREYGYKS